MVGVVSYPDSSGVVTRTSFIHGASFRAMATRVWEQQCLDFVNLFKLST